MNVASLEICRELCMKSFDGIGSPENPGYSGKSDTPEDAAAKLAVELFRQGVLTRE